MARHRFAEGRQEQLLHTFLCSGRKVCRRRHDKPKASAKGNNRANGATDRSLNRPSAPFAFPLRGRCPEGADEVEPTGESARVMSEYSKHMTLRHLISRSATASPQGEAIFRA